MSMNYYELFEIPVSPKVDKAILAKKYFELQRSAHPDYHTNATEEEKDAMLELSAHINKAFSIFKDEQKTIAYFLEQKGILSDDEKYSLSNDFLMEMMEFNEELENKDIVSAEAEIVAYQDNLLKGIQDILILNNTEISEGDSLRLKDYYYKKKYLQRILDRLHE